MKGHHRLGGDARLDVVGARVGFLREQRRQRICVLGDHLSLPGHERRTRGREPCQFGHAAPALAGGGSVGAIEDEADEGAQRRLARGPPPHRGHELVLERVHALVDEVLFGRKVVEDGLLGDIGGTGDLGDADLVEATLEEEAHRRLSDRPAGLLLLPLAKSNAGGGTEVFTTAVSFAGTFLFVVFVGAVAVEFSRGTFRTMLLHEPRRLRLLAGKMAGLLFFAAVVLAAAEALTWVAARLLAPSQDVATGDWISAAALGDALTDYVSVLFWVSGYALLGMTLAVLVRSVPVALAIGIAWAGPFEHLVQDAWDPANRVFPGLLLEAFVAGGTTEVSASRALLTVTVYLLIAATVAATTFARRDITA
jgi:ABC-2 type transport system permease protein